MAGYIAEFFGYNATDASDLALEHAASSTCPFLSVPCTKMLARDGSRSGVCAVRQKGPTAMNIICCPIRLYANDYEILRIIAEDAFGSGLKLFAGRIAVDEAKQRGGAVAVFGHRWGGELRLPKRQGNGSYFVDWVLAKIDRQGTLEEFVAVEVQTIDTTGNYRNARQALLANRRLVPDTVGLNWENVSKRILPQIIHKGQVLQREDLCKSGLYFVCPKPVYNRILDRLGGKDKLPEFSRQPASIHFLAYDYSRSASRDGAIQPLEKIDVHNTAVYKVQEAFSAITLPSANVYRDAILKALEHTQAPTGMPRSAR